MGCRQSLTLMKACKRTISIIVFKIMMGLWKFNYSQNTLVNGDWKHVIASVSADRNAILHRVKASLCGVMGNFLNCGRFHNCCKWHQMSTGHLLSAHGLETLHHTSMMVYVVWMMRVKEPDVLLTDTSDRIESTSVPSNTHLILKSSLIF